MSKWKKWLSTALLGFLLLPLWGPLWGQEASDTVYTFRFVAEEDMFYIPWRGNDKELSRLESCVSRYRERILSGEIPLRVEGWCNSLDSEQANLRMAAVRSNRVKSELIVRQGLTEECFITRNHATEGDFVTVRITVPKEDATAQEDEEARLAAERAGQQRKAAEEAERQRLEQERAAREQAGRERAEASRLAAEQARADSLAKARAEAEGMAETASPAAEKTSVSGENIRCRQLHPLPARQPAALGYTDPRLGSGVARPSLVGNPRERLVDLVVVAGRRSPLCPVGGSTGSALVYGQGEARLHRCDVQGCPVGGSTGSALVYGQGEARLHRCDVQGGRVQLQALRDRQAGRPDGRRHYGRLPAAAQRCPVAGL